MSPIEWITLSMQVLLGTAVISLIVGLVLVAVQRKVTLAAVILFFFAAFLAVGGLYNAKVLQDVQGGHSKAAPNFYYEFYPS